MSESNTRAAVIEIIEDAIYDATDEDGVVSPSTAAKAALTALEASGMAVVPKAKVERFVRILHFQGKDADSLLAYDDAAADISEYLSEPPAPTERGNDDER